MLGIRIRIRKFLGLQGPDPDPLVRGTNPDPNPSLFWNNACKIGFKQKILAKKSDPDPLVRGADPQHW